MNFQFLQRDKIVVWNYNSSGVHSFACANSFSSVAGEDNNSFSSVAGEDNNSFSSVAG